MKKGNPFAVMKQHRFSTVAAAKKKALSIKKKLGYMPDLFEETIKKKKVYIIIEPLRK